METAIVSLICIGVILSGGLIMAQSAIISADKLFDDWKILEKREMDRVNTIISATGVVDKGAGGFEINVRNTGQRVIGNFADWDVIVMYYDAPGNYVIERLTYSTNPSPGNDEWSVYAIQWNGVAEVYQKNLLDPLEDLKLQIKPIPPVGNGKTIFTRISTNNGVTTSIQYTK